MYQMFKLTGETAHGIDSIVKFGTIDVASSFVHWAPLIPFLQQLPEAQFCQNNYFTKLVWYTFLQ